MDIRRFPQPPLTDSPWLWLLVFCLLGWLLVEMFSGKYGDRQAQLERQHQGRQWAQLEQAAAPGETPPPLEYSTPDRLIITLWPLRALFGLLSLVGLVLLIREQARLRRPPLQEMEDAA